MTPFANSQIFKNMLTLKVKARLNTEILKSENTLSVRDQMWRLYNRYYQVEPASFFARFAGNDYYALYKKGDRLIGFTALRLKEIKTPYGKFMTFYVGQSIIDKNFRNRSLIPQTCVKVVAKNFALNPFQPLLVWCDSLTYKPYLAFAKATTEYYPTYKKQTPDYIKAVRDELGKHYYGENYDPATGTVAKDKVIVDDPSTAISEKDLQNPDIRFFTEANKNYRQGHGLITIVPANAKNFAYCFKRCLKKQLNIK